MKSIAINGKFLSAAPTGVHRVATELANALADLNNERHPAVSGLDLQVWFPRNGAERAQDIRLPTKRIGPMVGIPWEQLTLPLSRSDIDILSLCNIGPALSRNAVTMIHDAQVHISPASYSRSFRLWYQFIQPLFARRNRHIITVSEFSRQEIARVGLCSLDKISVVHNGVDHMLREQSDESAFERLHLLPKSFVLGLSTTQAHKNIAILLKAFADPALANLKLVLFGSTGRDAFEAAGMAVPTNVLFTGRISDGQLRGLIEQALCLAFPSTTEGFGLPPLEAMILGCPAIVAPCGALPEVCSDKALFAAPDQSEDWVEAITRLNSDQDLWEKMAQSGRKHATLYSWRNAALTLAAVLTHN